jgi:hypothetical protein
MKKIFCLLILNLLASACAPAQMAPVSPARETSAAGITPTITTEALPTEASPTAVRTAQATASVEIIGNPIYHLDAVVDYPAHTVVVHEEIAYPNRSGEAISELLLVADAQIYPGVFELQSLASTLGPAITSFAWEKTWLRVQLEQPLAAGETIILKAAFTLRLPQRTADTTLRPMVFGWSERQTNLVDWYLYLPPYRPGTGWYVNRPGYYGEHQVYEASDFSVDLQINTAPPGLTVAAPTQAQQAGEKRSYRLAGARTFALSFGPDYQSAEMQAQGVRIISYYWAYHTAAGQAALETAARAVELYSRLFGAYPYQTLSIIEADFLDGMEYDGLFFLSNGFYNLYDGSPGNYLTALAAHETAHQWWFGAVANDQANEPWLDEALCTYSEKLYLETVSPEAVEWWRQVRVLYYQPRGWVGDSIYNPHQEAQPYRAYRDAVYLNGAIFLDELRGVTGDDAFFAFLKDYAGRYRGKIAYEKDFFTVLAEHTSADLNGIRSKYFEDQ